MVEQNVKHVGDGWMVEKSDTKKEHNVTHAIGRNTRPETRTRKMQRCQNCREKVDKVYTVFNGRWKMRMCFNCREHALKNGWEVEYNGRNKNTNRN